MPRKLNLLGEKFGRLTVTKEAGRSHGGVLWGCECECGGYTEVLATELRSGHTKSCGCLQRESARGQKWKRQDLAGRRFGRLLVLKNVGVSKGGSLRWECLCDCGKLHIVDAGNLKNGTVKSCGCYAKEIRNGINKVHGFSRERLFRVWKGIKERCLNPNNKSFPRYGGRGITICDEWRNDYVSFRSFAIANGWKCGLQVNRKNNDLGYFPENVNFVTGKENANNRGKTLYVEFQGEKIPLSAYAEKLSISYAKAWRDFKKKRK